MRKVELILQKCNSDLATLEGLLNSNSGSFSKKEIQNNMGRIQTVYKTVLNKSENSNILSEHDFSEFFEHFAKTHIFKVPPKDNGQDSALEDRFLRLGSTKMVHKNPKNRIYLYPQFIKYCLRQEPPVNPPTRHYFELLIKDIMFEIHGVHKRRDCHGWNFPGVYMVNVECPEDRLTPIKKLIG
jgi:hypothetical protein